MPKLGVSLDCLADFGGLPKAQQKQVRELITKFGEHVHAGAHLEKMRNPADPRVRTVRVNNAYRGIVMAPDQGDVYVLHRILIHDKADKWVANNRFDVNPATGALEVLDLAALDAVRTRAAGQPDRDAGTEGDGGANGASPVATPLFAHIKDATLATLGIPAPVIELLAGITSEALFASLCTILPQSQADVLELLKMGFSVEDVWAELAAEPHGATIDTDDVVAALDRPATRAAFYVAEGEDDLLDVLNAPFDAWRVFLHPSQRRYAFKETFNGPARITGGPGTGKTVVAIHRARFLAERLGDSGDRVLFTTFTRNLAEAIERDLVALAGTAILDRVDVVNIDRVATRIVRDAEAGAPAIADQQRCTTLWQQIVDETGMARSAAFLDAEWRHVVLANRITTRTDYLRAPRPGRGVALNRRARIEVWDAIEAFTARLAKAAERTYAQIADTAAEIVEARSTRPYRHVIVDEAQDLHPAQWRLVRALTPPAPNDLFIVGDAHQRIYGRTVTLSKVGIEIRGRSHRLRLNYRTTAEILAWSLGLVRGEPFDDLDGGNETLQGYRSRLHGPVPTLVGFKGRPAELDALADQVRAWIDVGIAPSTIGVTARTRALCTDAHRALARAGIDATVLEGSVHNDPDKVAVGTMHRFKGLEFRCVAVVDADATRLPLAAAVVPADEDPLEHERSLRQERSLLFVAASRARDELWIGWAGQPSPLIESLIAAPTL